MRKHMKNLRQAGDTIVEVLIAIAVVSAVLAGAFTSVRQSTQTTRSAQEQSEALKLAEAQLEQIKAAVTEGTPDVISIGSFCIDGTTITGSCADTGSGGLYDVIVVHQSGTANFLATVTWDGLGGDRSVVELGYRAE